MGANRSATNRLGPYRSMLGLALRRPSVWRPLLGLAWASRREGWWKRAPFLPLPPADYLTWRAETAWGDADGTGSDAQVASYLHWAARMRRLHRKRGRG